MNITRVQLNRLLGTSQGPLVSIYLPTHRGGSEADMRQFKVALTDVENRLVAGGMRGSDAKSMLARAHALLDDSAFWMAQGDGLACFVGLEYFETFRLPLSFNKLVIVGNRFHVTPLLPLFSPEGRFFVLALSQNSVRLLRGTRFDLGEVDLGSTPTSLADALADHDRDEVLNLHTRPGSHGPRGEATFHGQGVGIDTKKSDLRTFFLRLDRALHAFLRDEHAPLVLAGVEYLLPIYREVTSYPHLAEESIVGSPDRFSNHELHDRAWNIVCPIFERNQDAACKRYEQLAGTGRTSAEMREILPATYRGEVETLFLAENQQCWGRFDADTGVVEQHDVPAPGDEELINLAAVHALQRERAVHAVPREKLPSRGPAAATFMLPLRKV